MIVAYDDINLSTNRYLTLQDDKGVAAILMPRITHDQAEAMALAANKPSDPMDKLIRHLREEHRIKINVDYSYISKFGGHHILCHPVWAETIQEHFTEAGINIISISTTE